MAPETRSKKRQRVTRESYTCPWADSSAIDLNTEVDTDSSLPVIRPIQRLTSVADEPATRIAVQFATSITLENERLIRSFHRSLEKCETVLVFESHGDTLWLVEDVGDPELRDTHAGGREIHILPYFPLQPPTISTPFYESPIVRRINCRKLLRPEDLEAIRENFPGSIGVRVLISGYIIVLFPSTREIEACWKTKALDEIGGQRIGYDIAQCNLSAAPIASGVPVSNHPEDLTRAACLGLRLRTPSGEEVITTVTHGFVTTVEYPSTNTAIATRCASWYLSIRQALQKYRIIKSMSTPPAVGECRDEVHNSPIGTDIWLAGTSQKIGTITKTFDPALSRHFPYPKGYLHDLSLITSSDLPALTRAPNSPPIVGWGSYADVLGGAPVFACRMNAVTGKWRDVQGRGMSRAAQAAIVQGSEYFWDRDSRTQTASLLWRTVYDPNSAVGFSGSVLCLGKLTDPTSRAVVFQNYEAALKPKHVVDDHGPVLRHARRAVFKAGFLLPQEIRDSEILLEDNFVGHDQRTCSATMPGRKSESSDRRIVTGP